MSELRRGRKCAAQSATAASHTKPDEGGRSRHRRNLQSFERLPGAARISSSNAGAPAQFVGGRTNVGFSQRCKRRNLRRKSGNGFSKRPRGDESVGLIRQGTLCAEPTGWTCRRTSSCQDDRHCRPAFDARAEPAARSYTPYCPPLPQACVRRASRRRSHPGTHRGHLRPIYSSRLPPLAYHAVTQAQRHRRGARADPHYMPRYYTGCCFLCGGGAPENRAFLDCGNYRFTCQLRKFQFNYVMST